MNDISKRIISAFVFLLLFVLAALNPFLFAAVFIFFMIISLKELCNFARNKNLKPGKELYLLAILTFIVFFIYFGFGISSQFLLLPLFFLFLLFIIELFRKNQFFHTIGFYSFAMFYIIVPFSLFNFLIFYSGKYTIDLLSLFFVVIWTNDIAAYFIGITFGKHKLMPYISPKKSIEGFLGGIISAALISVIFYLINKKFSLSENLILSTGIAIFGVLGDLFESKIKRELKIKDSGKIMPGHGGILDRFDSSIFGIIFLIGYWLIKNIVI